MESQLGKATELGSSDQRIEGINAVSRCDKKAGRKLAKGGRERPGRGLSSLQPAYPYREVDAIVVSDVHLSEDAPTARSAEPDWLAAMLRPINEVKELQEYYKVPVLLAGDLFHKPSPSPRLINWAISNLFECYGIPGNHELPEHRYDKLEHSAFWTVCEAGVVHNIRPGNVVELGAFGVCGFPFGYSPMPCTQPVHDFYYWVALSHQFIWKPGHSYPGAASAGQIQRVRKNLRGYAAAFFGDNHSGFIDTGTPNVMNVGGFMRRRRDERYYRPMVGILHKWGGVTPHFLDCSEDKFFDSGRVTKAVSGNEDLKRVCEDIAGLGPVSCDFLAALKERAMREDVGKDARTQILSALEKCQ